MIFIILLLKYKIPDIGAMIYSLEKKKTSVAVERAVET